VVDYWVRPMTADDVPAVERLTDQSYLDLSRRTHRTRWPEPRPRSPEQVDSWSTRVAHLVATDPRGCWVAEDGGGLLGVAISTRRDLTWTLAVFAVRTADQGRGVGRQLLEAAMSYGSGCLRSMVVASEDPLALRRYRLAGFSMHPLMVAWGKVSRSALPVVERVRDGSLGDVDLMNSVDRQVRDAAHGPDHLLMAGRYRLLVADRTTGSGYAYVLPSGEPYVVAATNRRTATDLLWECLAASDPEMPVSVAQISAANEWAIDVGMAARMELWTHNYLAVRGMRPPVPYLPSGMFL
jgi:GNAT superfamily N-acetyltransferase